MAEDSKLAEKFSQENLETVKFGEDEMKKVKDFQQTYIDAQNAIGSLSLTRIRLEQQLTGLTESIEDWEKKFVDTQQGERDFVDAITKKYGVGSLDPGTGVYTLAPQVATPEKSE
jgi:hypothetical protein